MTLKSAAKSFGSGLAITATVLHNSPLNTEIAEIDLELEELNKKRAELEVRKAELENRRITR